MIRAFTLRILVMALVLVATSRLGFGATLSAPVGGAPVPLSDGHVLCGDTNGGWVRDQSGGKIRPPVDYGQIGKGTSVRVAPSAAACASSKDVDLLVASGPIPVIDRRAVELWIDEGHLDVRGTNLEGSRLEWEVKGEHGSAVCVAASLSGGQ